MPSRKRKTKSRQTKSKAATPKRAKKVFAKKRAVSSKGTVKKKQSKKKTSSTASPSRNRQTPGRRRAQWPESSRHTEETISSIQSGDLEGLSRSEDADSESVEELVEEGNVFEAAAVAGVEKADDQDTKEVHTREVPEDDVPDEYLDKD